MHVALEEDLIHSVRAAFSRAAIRSGGTPASRPSVSPNRSHLGANSFATRKVELRFCPSYFAGTSS